MTLSEISIARIAESLSNSNKKGHKTCLLIGAGVSITAGIPSSSGFVQKIKENYPVAYAELKDPDYNACMSKLENAQQVELISEYIKAARINKAHIGIARMEKNEITNTILTTNFDPLASRACALFNQFPAIYDLANLGNEIEFDFSYVAGSAIFHLHGQHTGFKQFNDKAKLKAQAERIQPVLQAVMKGKPIIITGYSGENDPLIDEIVKLAPFNHGLYWICHDDKNPTQSVCDKLLSLDGCHIVRNMPADKFFDELTNALQLPQPKFLSNPFEHMLNVLETLKSDDEEKDPYNSLLSNAKTLLTKASENQNKTYPEIALMTFNEQYQDVFNKFSKDTALDDESKDLVAWAAIMLGNTLFDQAKMKQGAEADRLFIKAYEKYAQALEIKPNMHEALNNWGAALASQARTKQGAEADRLFSQAYKKYARALEIKPNKYEALYNWGIALFHQAKTKEGGEAENLLNEQFSKYEQAEKIKPGSGAYNIACFYAVKSNVSLAVHWLKIAKDKNTNFPDCTHIAKDTDFDLIRNMPEFQQALVDIGCG